MSSEFKRIIKRIRSFLFSTANKKFLIFLCFLFLSATFWLAMSLEETYEKEVSIPIRLANVPKNAIITTEMPDTIKVTIQDKGFTLLVYRLSDKLRSINLNFATYANDDTGKGNIPLSDVQNILYQRLYGSSTITAIKPDSLLFFFNYGESKKVPIRIKGNVKPAQSFYLANLTIVPAQVTVYARKEILDTLSYIPTNKVNIINFKEPVTTTVSLRKINGIKVIPSKINIQLTPDILIEKSVEVPIEVINTPADKVVRTFPLRVKVLFSVGAKMYKTVSSKQFKVVVDYNDIKHNNLDKCALHLAASPTEVRQAHLQFKEVDYVVEHNSLNP